MLRLLSSLLLLVAVAVGLSGCGIRPKIMNSADQIYDVRRAIVTADGSVPGALLAGIQRRVDLAIQMTHRPVALPHVVMDIQVSNLRTGMGLDGGQSQADVVVTLSDAEEGRPFLTTTLPVYSYTLDPDGANEALAEAIAARIRYTFSLSVPYVRPATYRKPKISTQMAGEEVPKGPIVVPVKDAPVIGTDADPVLNSKTKVQLDAKPAAKVVPAMKKDEAPKSVDDGASVAVKLGAKPAAEPCVETLEKKCPAP